MTTMMSGIITPSSFPCTPMLRLPDRPGLALRGLFGAALSFFFRR